MTRRIPRYLGYELGNRATNSIKEERAGFESASESSHEKSWPRSIIHVSSRWDCAHNMIAENWGPPTIKCVKTNSKKDAMPSFLQYKCNLMIVTCRGLISSIYKIGWEAYLAWGPKDEKVALYVCFSYIFIRIEVNGKDYLLLEYALTNG